MRLFERRGGRWFWAGVGLLMLPASASAVLINPRMEHNFRHTVTAPFATDNQTFVTNGFGSFNDGLTLGIPSNQASATQTATLNTNRLQTSLSTSFTGPSGFASQKLELRFDVATPTLVSFSGSANAAAADNGNPTLNSGGAGLTLLSNTDTFVSFIVEENGWSWQDNVAPVTLAPGRYELIARASLSSGQNGTVTNNLTVFFTSLGQTLAGDFDGSGSVEQADLDLVLTGWGSTRSGFLNDGAFTTPLVDQEELDAVLTNWGSSSSPSFAANPAAVPEPVFVGLAGFMGLALVGRRRLG